MTSKDKTHPEKERTRYGNEKRPVERDNPGKRNLVQDTLEENPGAASGADNYKG